MASVFTWIDHSEAERRRVLEAIDLFKEHGTRDELGLSTIRDGFADLMFPGTGSLQTRARYFFFVPWMYQALEADGVPSAEIARKARQFEVKLIDPLARSDDPEGAIGIEARAALQRLPSSIYWSGLKRLGIRLVRDSQEDYHRGLDEWYRRRRRVTRNDEGEIVGPVEANWRPGLPPAPKDFPGVTVFRMSPDEGEYLGERILAEAPSSLLVFLLTRVTSDSAVDFVWEHPLSARLTSALDRQLQHARNFSEVMHGALILYNLLLAEAEPRRDDLLSGLVQRFEAWRAGIMRREPVLRAWDRADFWRQLGEAEVAPTSATRAFVDAWIDRVLGVGDLRDLRRSADASELITRREHRLKGPRARLTNARARELWNGNSGLSQLEYRWRNAQTLLNDLLAARRSDARAR